MDDVMMIWGAVTFGLIVVLPFWSVR